MDNSLIDPDQFYIETHIASRDVGNVGVNTNTSKVPQLLIPQLKKIQYSFQFIFPTHFILLMKNLVYTTAFIQVAHQKLNDTR